MQILPRKNELIRPAVANIDQALVVFAVTKPKPHLNLLDRFLVMMESREVPVICVLTKRISQPIQILQSLKKFMKNAISAGIYQCEERGTHTGVKGYPSGKNYGDSRTVGRRQVVHHQSAPV